MASDRRTRLKILLDEHFLAIVLVLAVVAAGGAWATYTTAAAPGTHVEQRDVASWGVTGGFNHSAAVVNETPISERGAVRAGQHFYFTNPMPVLDGRFRFQVVGPVENAVVTTQATLVNYAVQTRSGTGGRSGVRSQPVAGNESKPRNQSERRLWELTAPLTTDRTRVGADGTTNTTFSVDVSDIRERARAIDQALGPISRVSDDRTSVAVTVRVNGTVAGERVGRSFDYTLPINSSQGYYAVYPPETPATTQFSVTRPMTVENDYGPLVVLASLVGLLVPLVALAGLLHGRANGWFDVSQPDRAEIQRATLRSEFAEWITTGTVPAEDDRTVVTIDSLEGLVDVAIDSDRRIVEDDDTGTYVVLDGDVRYRFVPDWTTDASKPTLDGHSDDEIPENASTGDGVDATASTPTRSADGDDGEAQPTAIVELSSPPAVDEGRSDPDSATDERSGAPSGMLDRLQSAIGSVFRRSNVRRDGSEMTEQRNGTSNEAASASETESSPSADDKRDEQ
ncbi:DUF5305 domain-containing protein [Halococcus dombrowskii]|uniref:DUF5305 domain-containing protein n=1 Tax=Halococcus dombrowskii TaxID=179637 RepID=A0AAV3SKL2_HALDO|nr:DUF5305 domain-containing protein [Halococcus dombrowskii]UOO96443.1 DUF5305 domain-containing protein [Halococcus dombrowskii]